MRRKRLLTAVLCVVLAMASSTVSSAVSDKTLTIKTREEALEATVLKAEGDDQPAPLDDAGAERPQPSTPAPQTQAPPPETQAPPPETQAPQTQPSTPAETQPSTPSETQPSTPSETQPSTPAETQPSTSTETPGGSGTEPSTEAPGETEQLPTETTPGSEHQTESESSSAEGTQTETQGETLTTEPNTAASESGTESESETESETESEEESESETSEFSSNEELIAHQNIVVPPKIELEFRFTQIEKRYAVGCRKEGTSVYESKSQDARAVGELEYYGSCYILEDGGDGWYYVESGNVRGFVLAEDVVIDEVALRIVNVKGLDELPQARLLVARTENAAFDYTHTTTQEVMADKQYAVASGEVKIYEQRKESSRVTGILSDQALCYILADADKEWVYVESGDARGFVPKSRLITGGAAQSKVSEKGENNMALAQLKVKPADNKACYYTLTSVKEASQAAKTREAMVNFALQFVGNPYVWGGTSLTHGADCSGFVQSVYANFGYSLPRVAEDQAGYGMQIPSDSAEPGDLIFYARNGYVYHVSMYIGDGRVVHASGKRVGITVSGIGGNAVWATRIIKD